MASEEKIFIVIPAFNEESKIGVVISGLKTAGYDNILVVNDGSTDKTREKALEAGTEVLDHIINRGQGAALRTGIEYVRDNFNPDVIVTFDADGQHRIEDIEKIAFPILHEDYDITLGSRFISNESDIPAFRKIILKCGVAFTRITSDINLTDTHNGFRGLGRKAARKINITQRGMEHASEIIDEIRKKHLRYKEIPIKVIYDDYSKSKGQRTSNFIKIGIKTIINKMK